MTEPSPSLRFPYMVFARDSIGAAPCSLILSGMPAPDPALLGAELPDLGFAGDALQALQERLGEHLGVAPERVLVTVGASSAMLLLALTYLRGARTAAETPSYQPLRVLPGFVGGSCATFERRPDEGWALDPERVRAALGRAGPAGSPGHVLVTSPHNPSGRTVPAQELERLAGVAADEGGLLISCEIYMEYAPRSERYSVVHLAPNTISVGSFTKAYGLGALRLGWIVLGDDVTADRARIEDAAFLDYVDPPTPILRMGIRALEQLPALRAPYERFLQECRPRLVDWLEANPHVVGRAPDHGLIAFPKLPGIEDTLAFRELALREHGVDVVPGEYFGAPGHVRIGFGLEPPVLDEALRRLTGALEAAHRA